MKKEKQILWLKALSQGLYRVVIETGSIERCNGSSWVHMNISPLPSGYIQYNIHVDGKSLFIYGHVAVWLAVNGEYEPGLIVNHNDFDRSNNAISNLKLSTQKENIEYSRLAKRWKNTLNQERLTGKQILAIRILLHENMTQMAISKELNVKRGMVNFACKKIKEGRIMKCEYDY